MKKIRILWVLWGSVHLWASDGLKEKEETMLPAFLSNVSQLSVSKEVLFNLCRWQYNEQQMGHTSSTPPLSQGEAAHLTEMIASSLQMKPDLLKRQMGMVGSVLVRAPNAVEALLREAENGHHQAQSAIELCRAWVPHYLKQDRAALSTLAYEIFQEEDQTSIPIYDQDAPLKGRRLDPGYSFGKTDLLLRTCLAKVSDHFDAQGLCPKVLDAGCGHGYALWKFLVAGAYVVACDNHPLLLSVKQSLNIPGKMSLKAKPYMQKGVEPKDRKKVLLGDMRHILAKGEYQNFFDISYGGNFIHCLSPLVATQYVQLLYQSHKKAGMTYASAHLPDENMFDIYRHQIDCEKEFPGYFMENITLNTQTETSKVAYVPLDEKEEDLSPVDLGYAHYRKEDKRSAQERYNQGLGLNKQMLHRACMGYDACSLSGLFKRAGFKIEDHFYLTTDGARVEVQDISPDGHVLTVAQLRSLARICLIAQKPNM